jgi:hypothetical protein
MSIEGRNRQAVKFLLEKGAETHIMDLSGEDACDKAIKFGLQNEFKQFLGCSLNKKIIPMLPSGIHPNYEDLPFYMK